jgi:hypothetical protein
MRTSTTLADQPSIWLAESNVVYVRPDWLAASMTPGNNGCNYRGEERR